MYFISCFVSDSLCLQERKCSGSLPLLVDKCDCTFENLKRILLILSYLIFQNRTGRCVLAMGKSVIQRSCQLHKPQCKISNHYNPTWCGICVSHSIRHDYGTGVQGRLAETSFPLVAGTRSFLSPVWFCHHCILCDQISQVGTNFRDICGQISWNRPKSTDHLAIPSVNRFHLTHHFYQDPHNLRTFRATTCP